MDMYVDLREFRPSLAKSGRWDLLHSGASIAVGERSSTHDPANNHHARRWENPDSTAPIKSRHAQSGRRDLDG